MAEVHQALARRGGDAALEDHQPASRRPTRTASEYMQRFETTPGRMLIGECLPQEPQGAVRDRQPPPHQEGDRRRHRPGLSPHRPEGHGAVRRRDHGAGLPPRVQGRHLVRQGRHDHPGQQGRAGRRDQGAGRRLRAAVPGRPDHPAGKVQQGDRRLEPLRRPGGERHDGRDPAPRRRTRTAAEARSTRST